MSHCGDSDVDQLTKTLTENFALLADEVQLLSDRKTILEHKLRFAHEQYQYLADKYAPADPEITSTIAKLQLPPDLEMQSHGRATFVPLPSRKPLGSKQQIAEAIRDGRIVSQKLAFVRGWQNSSSVGTSRSMSAGSSANMRSSLRGTSATTVLEQDFTVPGRKSRLQCPFASKEGISRDQSGGASQPTENLLSRSEEKGNTPHKSADPICAAMYAESQNAPPSVTGSATRCPIRYLDQHSPEEVAHYFETHKHEIPRSHEVCVKRYQRNEEGIRKLDAKYGNLVNMLQGLGQMHQPMLPAKGDAEDDVVRQNSNDRVENWAKSVSVGPMQTPDYVEVHEEDGAREGRFDRPLKEVRVGESPSRPWGIPVPFIDNPDTKPAVDEKPPSIPGISSRPAGKCPFGHGQKPSGNQAPHPPIQAAPGQEAPVFTSPPAGASDSGMQRMIFTGPVFIGYPAEQAVTLMQQWQDRLSVLGQH